MEIGLYEDWMKPQIAKLFSIQYGIKEEEFMKLIGNFYELPFQKEKCIRIVAIEGNLVVGFQSFFYWPYTINGKVFNSYQSGNSIVHSDYRGKGIFQKLLNYLDIHREELKIDFLIGFPIDASLGSLLRNNWQNLFNLKWFVKLINPLSVFYNIDKEKLLKEFPNRAFYIDNKINSNLIKILNTVEFSEWRKTHYDTSNYYSFHFSKDGQELVFKLKINIRKKVIKELIIGDILTTSHDASFIENALCAFINKAKKIKSISMISIAVNELCDTNLTAILLKLGYKKINKQIYFCIKPFNENTLITDSRKWELYRGDIDTW